MSETKECPNCKKPVTELLRVDADTKAKLSSDLNLTNPPDAICAECFQSFSSQLNSVAQKKSRRLVKEQHRLNLWRSRVHLIREARERFAIKDFTGAVMAYEKYFRVLEIIYEVKPNEIKVTHFNNSARSKELLVIASAYWDMVRIYDQSKRFSKRMQQCAEKLAEFLPFTPIYSEIMRKVDDYRKVAKNKDVFDNIIRLANKNKKRCFIATAAFQSPEAPTVQILCQFRDKILDQSPLGRAFTKFYYTCSPPVARVLDRSPYLQGITRSALTQIAAQLEKKFSLKTRRH